MPFRPSTWILLLTGLLPTAVLANGLRATPDVTTTLSGTLLPDESAVEDDLSGGVGLLAAGALPARTDLSAYYRLSDGDVLLALTTTVVLDGLTVERGDVVRFDGTGYTLELDAGAAGIPDGTIVDALSRDGTDLVVSLDTTVTLSGLTVADEDLVRLDGVPTLLFDGSAAGVPAALDLDGAHVFPDGRLWLSFDTSANVDGVVFDDEDVLEHDAGVWSMAYDGSGQHAGWQTADLDGLWAFETSTPPDADDDGIADVDEGAEDTDDDGTFNYQDTDSDDDSVVDGLDREPRNDANVLSSCSGEAVVLDVSISGTQTCAATESIGTMSPAAVTGTGDLLMISPNVSLSADFSVSTGGKLNVISADPTVTQ